jgi:hypothetical protein
MRKTWLSTLILSCIVLAGCGPAGAPPQEPSRTPRPEETFTPSENPLQSDTPEPVDMTFTPPPAEKFISLSKKDLAERLQIDQSRIEVVSTEEIVWPDSALGCPAPGMVYAQGRVPGYRIWLKAEGKAYDYHTDFTGLIVLCPEQVPDAGSSSDPSGPTPEIGVPIK